MKRHGPWTIKETHERFRGKLIRVFEDEVIRPNQTAGTYATIKLNSGVQVLALDAEGNVYLVKEFRYAFGRENVEAVGGAIGEGEKPIDAARRELREEVGIKAGELIELGELQPATSILDASSTLFLARDLEFVKKDEDGGEVLETVRMPFREAVGKALNGEFIHSTTCVLILRAQHYLQQRMK